MVVSAASQLEGQDLVVPQYSIMMLPDADRARVERTKLTDYLLSLSHPDGRSKAQFFMSFGFRSEDWRILAEALRVVGASNPIVAVVESPHGARYTINGALQTPDGRTPIVRTVWIMEPGNSPRLVTAYPL